MKVANAESGRHKPPQRKYAYKDTIRKKSTQRTWDRSKWDRTKRDEAAAARFRTDRSKQPPRFRQQKSEFNQIRVW